MTANTRVTTQLFLALVAAVILLLLFRQKPKEQVQSTWRVMAPPGSVPIVSSPKSDLDAALQRICDYGGATLNWPHIAEPCPPVFNGNPLVSDSVSQRLAVSSGML